MKHIAVLGSTGSIGTNTLRVIKRFPDKFRLEAISTCSNTALACRQAREFKPRYLCVADERAAAGIKEGLPSGTRLLAGRDGLKRICADDRIGQVVLSISGSAALQPLLWAIEEGKTIALANKEALVMAGPLIMASVAKHGAGIIPIDSEQSAIWQCLEGRDRNKLKNIYLTASGGPFREYPLSRLKKITSLQALRHPRWKMGRKISVDSATMMNKGLEVLEAMYLFGTPASQIKVVIHPEAIVHSMVEFVDGVVMAQLSVTDMRIPIQYALSYPQRLATDRPSLDFFRLGSLNFQEPDTRRFPCLAHAYRAAVISGTMPAVLNAANEEAVRWFLDGRLGFLEIARVIEKVMSKHKVIRHPGFDEILTAAGWASNEAVELMRKNH